MKYEDYFVLWLNEALSDVRTDIEAFCFNLNYPAGYDNVEFGIELIGASRFDKTDDDWGCDEIWEPKQRDIIIPVEFSTKDWEVCQAKMKALIQDFLNSANPYPDVLKRGKAVAIGFVDGHLDLIWVKE